MRTNIRIIFLILLSIFIGFFRMNFVQNTLQMASPCALDYIYPNSGAGAPFRNISDNTQIEDFFDSYISDQIEGGNLAGVTLSIVKGNNMTLAKGYGYRDIDTKSEVVANETLFRIGSISKLFTWTAIMQLYEQGKVDLHTDVNEYLTGFQIPDTFEESITLAHLMTHTAGFEETSALIFSKSDIFPELSEYLREILPKRQFKPGTVSAYSNYGAALAGLIVEEISEMPFEQYIEENIFQKLNMTHSTFYQTLPPNLVNSVSKSYLYANSKFTEGNLTYQGIGPAGAMCSTATDMAKFMIAQMNNGSYQGNQILEPATLALMQNPHFQPHLDFPSIFYGFYELNFDDQFAFGHGGDIRYFHSQMSFFPDYDFGIFISYNTESGGLSPFLTLGEFVEKFMETRSTEIPSPMSGYQNRVTKFTGEYRKTRMQYSTILKVSYAGGATNLKFTSNEEGQLILSLSNGQAKFVEIEENVFAEITGTGLKLFFAEDGNGNIKYVYTNQAVVNAYERLNWYEHTTFQSLMISISGIILQLSLLYWLIEGIIRLCKKRPHIIPKKNLQNENKSISEPLLPSRGDISILEQMYSTELISPSILRTEIPKQKRISNWPRWILGGIFVFNIGTNLFVTAMTLIIQMDSTFFFQNYLNLPLVMTIPMLLCAVIVTIDILLEWAGKNYLRPRPQKLWERIHFTFVVLSGIYMVWYLAYWGFL